MTTENPKPPLVVVKPKPEPQMLPPEESAKATAFIEEINRQPRPGIPTPEPDEENKTCDYCGRGGNLTPENVAAMSKDEVVVAAREHAENCEFINTHIRPLLDKARNLSGLFLNESVSVESMAPYSNDELRQLASKALLDPDGQDDYEYLDFAHLLIHELVRRWSGDGA